MNKARRKSESALAYQTAKYAKYTNGIIDLEQPPSPIGYGASLPPSPGYGETSRARRLQL
jgi:hypothetical protein